jgi:hypothetical protein
MHASKRQSPTRNISARDAKKNKCNWTREYYKALKAKIDAAPPGPFRETALEQIKPLGKEPFTVDKEAAKKWVDLAEASKAAAEGYPAWLAETLIETGCNEPGAPYVIRGLLQQLDFRFSSGDRQKAAIAKAFLEPGCEGGRGLSDDEKAVFRRLAGPPAK